MAVREAAVSVLGLGAMGSKLAATFAASGCDVTVWNRSPERAQALEATGCTVAPTAADAVAASPVVVVCVADEAAVEAVLDQPGVSERLAGTTLVNLTTIPAENVGHYADRVRTLGGAHLAGGILSYPRSIGGAEAVIVYSGDSAAFARHQDVLASLAGAQRYVGDRDGDAAVVYTGSWTYYYGALGGFFEGAAYAASCGVDLAAFDELVPAVSREIVGGVRDAVQRVRTGDFSGEQGPVDGHVEGLPTFVGAVRSAGVDADVLEGFLEHCRRAAAAGYGSEDVSAVLKALRRR